MSPPPLDLLVLGSGVAGLSAAVRAAETHRMRVGVLTKGELHQSTTRWAQGGVAAVLRGDPDSTDAHLADTLRAGAGLCDIDAVRVLVDEGPWRVSELIALGAIFDRDAEGEFLLAREGGHSHARVLHAGGAATGVEVERALVEAVRRTAASVHEHWFALDLLIEGGRCVGVRALTDAGFVAEVRAANVLVATGGAGQMFAVTTNPIEATGDGIAMALRAGAAVADVEFVQFHPTALHHAQTPRPLLSEALRGHGAVLRDLNGDRFVDELLPRDEVSRAITAKLHEQHTSSVWLDVTTIEGFEQRFPTIDASMRSLGFDPARQWLPVAPAAHYVSGGLVTDLDGASTLPGLWGAGETTCTGVHGANRLASNSLLDGMVFGFRVVEAVERGKVDAEPSGAMRSVLLDAVPEDVVGGQIVEGWRRSAAPPAMPAFSAGGAGQQVADTATDGDAPVVSDDDVASLRDELQWAMTIGAGVLRSADSLAEVAAVHGRVADRLAELGTGTASSELANLVEVSGALVAAARARTESRGAHTREDFPARDDEHLRVRLVLR
jgi:L-aspartate oxidase